MKPCRIYGLFILIFTMILSTSVDALVSKEPGSASKAGIIKSYGKLPLSFERNEGQAADEVKFLARWGGRVYWFTPKEVLLEFAEKEQTSEMTATLRPEALPEKRTKRHAVRISFPGSNSDARVEGLEQQTGKVNYFLGNDKNKWRTDVPIYSGVIYRNLWEGIDLKYEGRGGNLKYEFLVAPGANPGVIKLAYAGIDAVRVSDAGELIISTKLGDLVEAKPAVYQVADGKKKVIKGSYCILENGQIGFELEGYDPRFPMVIDPLLYSTYLGGNATDIGYAIAVDSSGNAYVTGGTRSTNFPLASPSQASYGGGRTERSWPFDVFVTKMNPSGSGLVYSTYLGGNGDEKAYGIAVDGSGNAYITGITESNNFPTLNPIQAHTAIGPYGTYNDDAFVTKLNPTGSLVYSTYLGGTGGDGGNGIAVDSAGNAYITGWTQSPDFPTASPLQPAIGGTPYYPYPDSDAFVTKINAEGSALIYSTYLGGQGEERGTGIAVDNSGNAYITGYAGDIYFPTTPSAYQPVRAEGLDAFITKINANGSALIYSTYLGGDGREYGGSIAVDRSGNAYIAGTTASFNFPVANPFQPANAGFNDCFITKLSADGSALVYSTYLGGSYQDECHGVAIDSSGNVFVTGFTQSTDYPVESPDQALHSGPWYSDIFITKINASGSSLLYSTYFGGNREDEAFGIAVDSAGSAYITGRTNSTNFPTKSPYQPEYTGDDPEWPIEGADVFVSKITINQLVDISCDPTTEPLGLAPEEATITSNGGTATFAIVCGVPPFEVEPPLPQYLSTTLNPDATITVTGQNVPREQVTGTLTVRDATYPARAAATARVIVGGTAQVGGTLNGEVIDDTSGTRISGAFVSATGPSTYSATTDASGTFAIAGMVPGTYTVNASCSGCQCTPATVTISEGGSASVTLHCTGSAQVGGTLTGEVIDDTAGTRISGASISATGPSTYSATTGANGTFTITGMVPGSYTVTGSCSGCQCTPATVTISGGGSASVIIHCTRSAQVGGTLTGEVFDNTSGTRISGASVSATGPSTYSATTGANGTFTITGMVPGSYTVTGSCSGCQCTPGTVTISGGGSASVIIHCTRSTQACLLDMSSAQASFGCDLAGIPHLTIRNIGFMGQQFVVNWKMNLINGNWVVEGLGEGITGGIGILDFTEAQCAFSECVSMAIHNIEIFDQEYSLRWQMNMQTGDWEFAGAITGPGTGTPGTISGRVTRSGFGLGVITVTATDGTSTYTATTSPGNLFSPGTGGAYTLDVPAGTYEVRFSGSGYQTLCISNVRVGANETTTLNVALQRGSGSPECVPYSEYTGGSGGI